MHKTIPSLTGLRFLAALCVVLSHATPFILPIKTAEPAWHVCLASLAGIGMPLFFVLSGFVIHYNYSDSIRRAPRRGIFNFFTARFARIYPLFIACLAYDLIFSYTYSNLPRTTGQALPYYATMTQTWSYRVLGSNALVYQFGAMPSVGWSIATEWFFYCAYPLICFGLARVRTLRGTFAAAAILSAAAIVFLLAVATHLQAVNQFGVARFGPIADFGTHTQDSFFRWLVYFSPYSRILEFLAGCLCADVVLKRQQTPVRGRERQLGGLVTGFALASVVIVYAVLYPYRNILPVSSEIITVFGMCFGLAWPCALLIFCCARYDNAIVRVLASPMLVDGGEASYSLYMLHLMVIYAFRWEAAPITSFTVGIGDTLRLALTVMSAVGLAVVSWRIIEVPARTYLRRTLTLRPHAARPELSLESLSS